MTSTLLWTLISIQIAMGAFDTLYHHEFTERLAWRPSQGRELKLHAVRNAVFGRKLANALHRPAVFAVPAQVLRLMLGQFADELLLAGQRVVPSKALASGFHFEHADIASAFASMLGEKPKHVASTQILAT